MPIKPDNDHGKKQVIDPSMTVLDVVSANNATQEVFKRYDFLAKECICCNCLFESLEHMAAKYGINLEELLRDLNQA